MGKPRLLDPDVLQDDRYYFDWDLHREINGPGKSVKSRQAKLRASWWLEEANVDGILATREKHLQRLWAEEFTGEAVGRKLGTTRRAALGKAHRLGLLGNRPRGRRRKTIVEPTKVVGRTADDPGSPHIAG